jgi:PAS domain S-box-containing protein
LASAKTVQLVWKQIPERENTTRKATPIMKHPQLLADPLTGERVGSLELAKIGARLNGILFSAMDAIISVDADQRIVLFNPAAEKMFAISAQDVLGQKLDRFIPPHFGAAHAAHVNQFGRTGVSFRRMGDLWKISGMRSNGEEFPIEASISQVDVDGEKLFTVILRDVSERECLEKALRESQASRKAAILESALDCIISMDQEGKVLEVNSAAKRLFGYAPDEMVGKEMAELIIPPSLREAHRRGLARYLATGAERVLGKRIEMSAQRRDGTEFPVELTISTFQINGCRCFTGTLRDITDRKLAEQKLKAALERLRRSEAFLADAQRLSSTGGFTWRVATGEITWSDELYRIYELEIGVPVTLELIRTRVHPEDVSLIEKMRMLLEAGVGGENFEWQYRLMMPDHSIKYLHVVAHATRDENDQLEYIAAVQDVTTRRLSEEARARRNALRAEVSIAFANEAATGEILARCAEAIVHHLDAASARIWTLNKEENVLELQASAGLNTHLGRPESRVPVGINIGLIVQEGKPYLTNDILHDPRISDKKWAKREGMVAFAGYPLIIEDRAVGVMAMFSRTRLTSEVTDTLGPIADLTAQCIERKRTEETLNATKAELVRVSRVTTMGELAASVAHEVKQPLAAAANSATAGLNWLNSRPPNLQKARNSLKRIVQESDRASDILTRIREMLQKAPMTKTLLSINDVVKDVVAVAKEQLRRHQVSLKTELAADLPKVLGDRIQLQQVLLNLVINAIEAMAAVRKGPRQLLIRSCSDLLEERRAVLVVVRDSGLGLSEKDVAQIFKAFFTTKSQGMGMGLSISRSIIEAHGGRLSAQKNNGRGATFQFALPSA